MVKSKINFLLTAHDIKALLLLAKWKRTRAGHFGQELAGANDRMRKPQSYARSGGKALNRLEKRGYARRFYTYDSNWGWEITEAGLKEAKQHAKQ